MRKPILVYVVSLLVFGSGIYFALVQGKRLEGQRAARVPSGNVRDTAAVRAAHPSEAEAPSRPERSLLKELTRPLPRLLLQLVVVVLAARICGAIFRRIGQPGVVGEIVAGIALGPSLLGAVAPGFFGLLFEESSLGFLKLLAEIGVLLFLFLVGLELDIGRVRNRAQTAVVVSHASIVIPCALGVWLSLFLYDELAPAGVTFLAFALFMGIAMSITAFPVLARILTERGLAGTELGSTAISCAAVDDATAWSLLAVVVCAVGARGLADAATTMGLTLLFFLAMIRVVGPGLRRWLAPPAGTRGSPGLAGPLLILFASALATELIGIHALFGAFLAGAVMPREAKLRRHLTERLEELGSVILLPLFFAFTGLRTQVGLLSDIRSWLLCLLIILVATVGKLGGSMVAARLTGVGWIEAFELGALMNTRGLMELVALNVGYELGILSPRIFTMMVLMALATTFATAPLLSLAGRLRGRLSSAQRERAGARG